MRVVVVTRDNAHHLLKTARSLVSSGIDGSCVLVVDDSPSECSIARNRVAVERAFGRPPQILSRCRQEEILTTLPSETRRFLSSHFELGKPGWNAYAARNVGLLWSARHRAGHCNLWLDDDVDVSNEVVRLASKTPRGHISAFPLLGLPDFSRAKWMAMYLSCIDSVPQNGDSAQLAALLRAHTDLGALIRESQVSPGPFPLPWNAAHGAAYATNISLAIAPLFPAFRGEDYFWHRRLLDLGARQIRRRAAVWHRGRRRDLLNAPFFVDEEMGAVQATCLRLVLLNPNMNVRKTLETLAARRCRELGVLSAKAEELTSASAHSQGARNVLYLLGQVINDLSNPQAWESAAEQVADSLEANAIWARVGLSLSGNSA